MRTLALPLAAVTWLLALSAHARAAEEPKPVMKTGGSFAVEVVKDIPYIEGKAADPEKHKLDLYLPKGHKDYPVIFFVHGGTWRSGDRKLYGALGNVFAKNGIGVAITSYRLSPKVQHPAHIQDVARAFAWTSRNISKHGGRADQLFAAGHSAGGHLVALLATDESYLKAEQLGIDSIKGVIGLSGVYTIRPARFANVFGSEEAIARQASPLTHVNGKHPPFLILYADKDYETLDRMAEDMCAALLKSKVESNLIKVKDRDHISIIVRAINADDPTTQAIMEFVARHSGLVLNEKKP